MYRPHTPTHTAHTHTELELILTYPYGTHISKCCGVVVAPVFNLFVDAQRASQNAHIAHNANQNFLNCSAPFILDGAPWSMLPGAQPPRGSRD